MKNSIAFFALFFSLFSLGFAQQEIGSDTQAPVYNNANIVNYNNPVDAAKQIIEDTYAFWTPLGEIIGVHGVYQVGAGFAMNGGAYILLEAPSLCVDMVSGGIVKVAESVSTDIVFEVIESAVQTPKKLSKKIAKSTIKQGLDDYDIAYDIARKYIETGEISYYEAILFLRKRWGIFKLGAAQKLWNDSYDYTPEQAIVNNVIAEGKALVDNAASVPALEYAGYVNRFNQIMKSKHAGLHAYKPYTDYLEVMEEINRLKINEFNKWNPSIIFLSPDSNKKWDLNQYNNQLKWESGNLPDNTTILFYLFNKQQEKLAEFETENSGYIEDVSQYLNNLNLETKQDCYLYAYVQSCDYYRLNNHPDIVFALSETFSILPKNKIELSEANVNWKNNTYQNLNWTSNFEGQITIKFAADNEFDFDFYTEKGQNTNKIYVDENMKSGTYRINVYADNQLCGVDVISINIGNSHVFEDNPFEENANQHDIQQFHTPDAFTKYFPGQLIDASWTFSSSGDIAIDIYHLHSKVAHLGVVSATMNACNHYNIPANITPGNNYRLKLFDTNNPSHQIMSEYFSIIEEVSHTDANKSSNFTRPIRRSFAGRNIDYIANITVTNNVITVTYYDHELQDNDNISLYLNGETIVKNKYLTNRGEYVRVRLNENTSNNLFLFANNLGTHPPNTVALIISDGNVEERLILKSTLNACEGISIHVK